MVVRWLFFWCMIVVEFIGCCLRYLLMRLGGIVGVLMSMVLMGWFFVSVVVVFKSIGNSFVILLCCEFGKRVIWVMFRGVVGVE